jgi:hypothetical protein
MTDVQVDPTTRRLQDGLKLFEALKGIEDEGRALFAIAEMEDEDLRAIVTYKLYQWHQATPSGDDSHSAWRRK